MELRKFAEQYTAAWCSQNPASVAGFFADDGWLQVNDNSPAIGREAITALAQGFMTEFPDLQVHFDGLEPTDAGAVYRWTLTGTHCGTGYAVCVIGFEEWTMAEDGRIARSKGHFDAAEYARQVVAGS